MVRSDKKRSSKSSSCRSTHTDLPRLPVKEETPTGIPSNGPPIWQRLPLDAKLPMVAGAKDYVVLSRRYALSSLYLSLPNQPFDLSDPYNRISPRFELLHDPHVKDFVNWGDHFRALEKQGLVTPSGHVICTLQELNQYRRYLHHVKSLRSQAKFKQEVEQMKRQKEEETEQRRQRVARAREQGVSTIVSRAVKQKKEREFQEMRKRLMQKEREEQDRLKKLMEEQNATRSQREAIRFFESQARFLRAKEIENKKCSTLSPSEMSWLGSDERDGKSTERSQNSKLVQQEQMRRLWVERWQQQLQRMAEEDARKEEEKESFQKRVSERQRKMQLYWQRQQEKFEKYRREKLDGTRSPGFRESPCASPADKSEQQQQQQEIPKSVVKVTSNIIHSIDELNRRFLIKNVQNNLKRLPSLNQKLVPLTTLHLYNQEKLEASLTEATSEDDEVFIRFNHTNIYLHHRGKLDKAKNYVLLLKSIFEGIKMPKSPSVETVVSCLTQWVEQEACDDYYDIADSMWSILMKTILEELQVRLQKTIYINEKEWVVKTKDLAAANRISDTVTQMALEILGKTLLELIKKREIPPVSLLMDVVHKARDFILQETWQIISTIYRGRIGCDKINLWQLVVRQVINKMVFQSVLNFIGWIRDRINLWPVVDAAKLDNVSTALVVTLGCVITEVARAAIMKSVLDLELSSENIKENFITYFFTFQHPLISSVIAWAEGHLWYFLDSNRRFPRIEEIESDVKQLTRSTLELIYTQVFAKLGQYCKRSLEEMLVDIILGGLLNKLQQRLIMNETSSNPAENFPKYVSSQGCVSSKANDIVAAVLKQINSVGKDLSADSQDFIRIIQNSSKALSELIFQTVSNMSLDIISKATSSATTSDRSSMDSRILTIRQNSLVSHLLTVSSQIACSYASRMIMPTTISLDESCTIAVSQIKLSARREIKNICKQRKKRQSAFSALQTLLGCICHDMVQEMEYKIGRLLELTTSNYSIHITTIARVVTLAFEIEYLDLALRKLITIIEKNRLKKMKIEADACQLHESQVSLAIKKEQQWIVKAIIRNIMLRWQELLESNQLPSQSAMKKLIDEVVSIANPEGLHEIALRLRYMMEEKLKDTDAKLVQAAEELVGETFFTVCRELWIEGRHENTKSEIFISEVIAIDDAKSKISELSANGSSSAIYTFQKNSKYDMIMPSVQINIANLIIKFSKKESGRLLQHVNKLVSNKIILREVAYYVVDKALQCSFPGVWCKLHGCHTVWSTPYFEVILEGIVNYLQQWEDKNKNYFDNLFNSLQDSQLYRINRKLNKENCLIEKTCACRYNEDKSEDKENKIDSKTPETVTALSSSLSYVKTEYNTMTQNFHTTVSLIMDNLLLKTLSLQFYEENSLEKLPISQNIGRASSHPSPKSELKSGTDHLEVKKSEIHEVVSTLVKKVVNVLSNANQSLNFDPGGKLMNQLYSQRNLSLPLQSRESLSSKNVISSCESDIKSVVKSIVDLVSIVVSRSSNFESDITETEVINIQENQLNSRDNMRSPSSEHETHSIEKQIEAKRSVSLIQLPISASKQVYQKTPDNWPIPVIHSIVDNVIHKVIEALVEKINEASTGEFEAMISLSHLPETQLKISSSTKANNDSEQRSSGFTGIEINPLENKQVINKADEEIPSEDISIHYTEDSPRTSPISSRVLNVTPTDFKENVDYQMKTLEGQANKEFIRLIVSSILRDEKAWGTLQQELCQSSSKQASLILNNYITDQYLKDILTKNGILPTSPAITTREKDEHGITTSFSGKDSVNVTFSDPLKMNIERINLQDTCAVDNKCQRKDTDIRNAMSLHLPSSKINNQWKIPNNLAQENVESILNNIQDIREKIKTVNSVLAYLHNALQAESSFVQTEAKYSDSTISMKSTSYDNLSSIQDLTKDEDNNQTNRTNRPSEKSNKSVNFLLAQPSEPELIQNSLSNFQRSDKKSNFFIQKPTFHTLTLDLVHLCWQHLKRMANHLRRKRRIDLSRRVLHAKSDAGPMREFNFDKSPFYKKYFSLNAVCDGSEINTSDMSEISSSTKRSLASESFLPSERKNQYLVDSLRSTFLEDIMKETVHHFHNNYSTFLTWKDGPPPSNKYSLVELQNNMSESLLYFIIHSLQQEIMTRQSIVQTTENLASDRKSEYWQTTATKNTNLHFTQSAVTNILRETVQKLIEIMKTIYISDDREENFMNNINFDDSSLLTTSLANKVINRVQEVAFENVLCNKHLSRALSYEREPGKIAVDLLNELEYYLQNSKNLLGDDKEIRSRILQTIISEIVTKLDKIQDTMPKKVVSLVKDLLLKVHTELFRQLAEKQLSQDELKEGSAKHLAEYKKISAVSTPRDSTSMTKMQRFQELKNTTGKEVINFLRDTISNMVQEYIKKNQKLSHDYINDNSVGQNTEKLVANAIEGVIHVLNDELQELVFGLRRQKEKRVQFDPVVMSKEIVEPDAKTKSSIASIKPLPCIKKHHLGLKLNNNNNNVDSSIAKNLASSDRTIGKDHVKAASDTDLSLSITQNLYESDEDSSGESSDNSLMPEILFEDNADLKQKTFTRHIEDYLSETDLEMAVNQLNEDRTTPNNLDISIERKNVRNKCTNHNLEKSSPAENKNNGNVDFKENLNNNDKNHVHPIYHTLPSPQSALSSELIKCSQCNKTTKKKPDTENNLFNIFNEFEDGTKNKVKLPSAKRTLVDLPFDNKPSQKQDFNVALKKSTPEINLYTKRPSEINSIDVSNNDFSDFSEEDDDDDVNLNLVKTEYSPIPANGTAPDSSSSTSAPNTSQD